MKSSSWGVVRPSHASLEHSHNCLLGSHSLVRTWWQDVLWVIPKTCQHYLNRRCTNSRRPSFMLFRNILWKQLSLNGGVNAGQQLSKLVSASIVPQKIVPANSYRLVFIVTCLHIYWSIAVYYLAIFHMYYIEQNMLDTGVPRVRLCRMVYQESDCIE